MINITGLNKVFPTPFGQVTALNDISLSIAKGDIFGIIGFSGAGKSTLIRCINSLEEPDSGTITLADRKSPGVVRKGDEQRDDIKKRVAAMTSPAVKKFIGEKYGMAGLGILT